MFDLEKELADSFPIREVSRIYHLGLYSKIAASDSGRLMSLSFSTPKHEGLPASSSYLPQSVSTTERAMIPGFLQAKHYT